jgi:amino acid transporter
MDTNEDIASAFGSRHVIRAQPVTLSGKLGTFDIVFTVLAHNAPLTVVTGMIALVMSLGNGLGAPVAFVVAGGLMVNFAIGLTRMSKDVPNADLL